MSNVVHHDFKKPNIKDDQYEIDECFEFSALSMLTTLAWQIDLIKDRISSACLIDKDWAKADIRPLIDALSYITDGVIFPLHAVTAIAVRTEKSENKSYSLLLTVINMETMKGLNGVVEPLELLFEVKFIEIGKDVDVNDFATEREVENIQPLSEQFATESTRHLYTNIFKAAHKLVIAMGGKHSYELYHENGEVYFLGCVPYSSKYDIKLAGVVKN